MSGSFSSNASANALGVQLFDAAYYLSNNADVLAAVSRGETTALEHFAQFGRFEGRAPTSFFNAQAYIAANPDVANYLGSRPDFSAFDHFINFGVAENRGTGAFVGNFDAQAYLASNADVADAVESGMFRSAFEHFILFGAKEGRAGFTTEGVSLTPATFETFTLTTGVDAGPEFTGGQSDSVFNAALGVGVGGLVAVQTLQGSDVLNGGVSGSNVLNAELNGTGTTANPTISNIQQYYLTSFAGPLGFGNGALDLSRATGYEELWNRDSRADLDLFSVGEVATLGLQNVRDGSEFFVEYDGIEVGTQKVVAIHAGREVADVSLDIEGVNGGISTLDLSVSEGVYLELQGAASEIENLIISGSGELRLSGEDDFANLNTLDTLGYDGNVNLDISGSDGLESVLTGDGDDVITAAVGNFSTPTTVDLGQGDNRLVLVEGDSAGLSAMDFTLGSVSNVQTLELASATLDADTSLALQGVGSLETLVFSALDNSAGSDLSITGAPPALSITTAQELEMNGGLFTIEGAVDLVVTSTGPQGDDSDIRLDGGVNSATLQSLLIEAADDAELTLAGGTDALTTVKVVALDEAAVDITVPGARGDATELGALANVNVIGASATLTMTGREGVEAFAGTQATQSFTVNVTGGAPFGPLNVNTASAGNVFFTSGGLPGGFLNTTYSTTVGLFLGANSTLHDIGAAADIAAALGTVDGLMAVNSSNTVNVTWDDVGLVEELVYQSAQSGATTGTLNSVTGTFVQGQEAIELVEGEGFEAVEAITVDAEDGNAEVNLTDVYGAFALDVTATGDANVALTNTNVTSATVFAGETATVGIGGNTVGAHNLLDLTVSGGNADVTLSDNLSSFKTLDVSGVSTKLVANTADADFAVDPGQFLMYQIGATSDGIVGTIDVSFTGNLVREVYSFVGSDIGEVAITDFSVGADPAIGDRLNLSAFASDAAQLVFTDNGTDIIITDLAGGVGDFSGSITIVGATGLANDIAQFNILFA